MSDVTAGSRTPRTDDIRKSPGVSGKRLTIVVLLTLVATGALFYWVATAYGTYNAARRHSDAAWRTLAVDLEARYRAFGSVVKGGVESGEVDAGVGQKWRASLAAFTGTSLSAHQILAARDLEAIIQSLPAGIKQSVAFQNDELKTHVEQYRDAAADQRAVRESLGSLVLKRMLVLPEPIDFQLAQ